MIAERFEYRRPGDVGEAVSMLADDPGGARVLGGGTWLIPEMTRGETRPRIVVDLAAAGLAAITREGDELLVGTMATYADLLDSPLLAQVAPLLRLVAESITGGWSIRNQGTIGGSVAAARPQSDIPAALVTLGADAIVRGPGGERRLPVGELIAGAMRTTLAPGELLSAFAVPVSRAAVGYYKLKRGASSWPILTAAAMVTIEHGVCGQARLVLGAAATTPVAVDVTDVLVGQAVTADTLEQAGELAAASVHEWWEDALAPAEYRARTAAPVARRALAMAFETEARGS